MPVDEMACHLLTKRTIKSNKKNFLGVHKYSYDKVTFYFSFIFTKNSKI